MSRKTTVPRLKSASAEPAAKTPARAKSPAVVSRKPKESATMPTRPDKPEAPPASKGPPAAKSKTTAADRQLSPTEILNRAQTEVATAIETLNRHMNSALATFTELASAEYGRGKAVIRTAPLDRATAAFQRLVAEVVDEQLGEMLPPLVNLRNEMVQRVTNGTAPPAEVNEFHQRGSQALDHILSIAGARCYDARPGETFDPLIHLAVGETNRPDLADGAVAESLQPGFRSARGKVLVPAKVKVNRR